MYRLVARSVGPRRIALVFVEHAVIVLSVVAAAVLRLGIPDQPVAEFVQWAGRAVVVAAILQLCLYYCDLYDLRTLSDRRDLLTGLMRALGAASVMLAILYYWLPDLIIGRGVFALATVLIIMLVAGWRIAFEWLSLRGEPAERLLIAGTGSAAVTLARELFERRSELGVEIVGF